MNIENEDNIHKIILSKTYNANTNAILNLFKDGTIFKLTGADEINFDFCEGGKFLLVFNNRGKIFGSFIKITKDKLILDWNVEGFNRPCEINTLLDISFTQNGNKCSLNLEHTKIFNKESAEAKNIAWREILNVIENKFG